MLPSERKVTYEDLARAAAGTSGAEPPSILKTIFHDAAATTASSPRGSRATRATPRS